ncbi:MAG TPA: hypothetical protein VF263_12980 [Longimicrobiaceae bacterium]
MKNRYTLLTVGMFCLGLSACGNSSLLAPESPSFDGGHTIGSGNRADSTTAGTSSTGTIVDAERGGFGIGSGNRTEGTTTSSTERGGLLAGSGNRTEETTTTSTTPERNGGSFGSGN